MGLPNPGVQPRAKRVGCNDALGRPVLFGCRRYEPQAISQRRFLVGWSPSE